MRINNLLKSCCVIAASFLSGTALGSNVVVSPGAVTSHDPWDGVFEVSYAIIRADPAIDYKVAFEVIAGGRTAAVTNAAARLEDGVYVKTLDTAALFGAATADAAAHIRILLLAQANAALGPLPEVDVHQKLAFDFNAHYTPSLSWMIREKRRTVTADFIPHSLLEEKLY